jgi:nucleotide-binding universal stress UspA family protein
MIHLDRILFPTDGSPCAEQARRHAAHLANRFDTELHIIRVEERDAELTDVIEICSDDVLADLHAPLEESVVATPRVQERRVVHRSAAGGILAYATEHDIDLIVLGTHGRRGVRRLLLGSVAEEVVRRASCPVFTVGRSATSPEALDGGTLLVPVDFSSAQAPLLDHARELALAYGLSVVLLHAVERTIPPDVYGLRTDLPSLETLADRAREALGDPAAALRNEGLEVTTEVRTGSAVDVILDVAEEKNPAMLAIATHGRRGVERMLMGSVSENVVRQAPCPVFTVKSFGKALANGA